MPDDYGYEEVDPRLKVRLGEFFGGGFGGEGEEAELAGEVAGSIDRGTIGEYNPQQPRELRFGEHRYGENELPFRRPTDWAGTYSADMGLPTEGGEGAVAEGLVGSVDMGKMDMARMGLPLASTIFGMTPTPMALLMPFLMPVLKNLYGQIFSEESTLPDPSDVLSQEENPVQMS